VALQFIYRKKIAVIGLRKEMIQEGGLALLLVAFQLVGFSGH
jgi:hypothetical protein